MDKFIYWMKKLGILRTSSYTAKGNAKKLVELDATDGGMIQSQKEIDVEEVQRQERVRSERQNNTPSVPGNKEPHRGGNKILFWILVVIAVACLLILMVGGLTFWFFLGVVIWGLFLRSVWTKSVDGVLVVGKTLGLSIGMIIISFVLVGIAMSEESGKDDSIDETQEKMEDGEDSTMNDDTVTRFLKELRKETKINFSDPVVDEDVVWPAANVKLGLTGSKSFAAEGLSAKDFDRVQKFFLDRETNDGGLGFTFVPPAGTKSSGFVLLEDEYEGLMCILVAAGEDGILVGCGWGPGGEK